MAELTFLSLVLDKTQGSGGLRLQAASSLATSVPEAITRLSTEAALLRAMQARCAARVPSSAWKYGNQIIKVLKEAKKSPDG